MTAGPVPSPPPDGLLDAGSVDALTRALDAVRDEVTHRIVGARRPFTGAGARGLRRRVDAVDLEVPLASRDQVLAEVGELYLDDAVWFHHPRYVAHLNCPVAVPAVAADLMATAVNSSLDTWDQSAGATHIERRLVRWTAERLGLGPHADGVFTSGGTQSNLQSLLIARESCATTDLSRLRVLVSADGHFSVAKAARLLGLGPDAVVQVAVDHRHRMRVDDLARRLRELDDLGLEAMAVVATAGTTDLGAIDPLEAVAEVTRQHGVWLHVDAAYGGGLVTSSRHRGLLDGIEHADSVTVDFHKTFFQPVAASVALVRESASLAHVAWHADYLNPSDADADDRPNQVDKSLQTTRRFDALKLWWTLRELGADRLGDWLDAVLALAADTHRLVEADPDFEAVTEPELSTVVFRYAPAGVPDAALDTANTEARAALFDSGEAVVAGTRIDGRAWLKVTLLNPATELDDLRFVLDRLRRHAAMVLAAVGAGDFVGVGR